MSTVPVSRPAVPPQPDAASYSIQELALFKTYSRESYRSAFGLEAPAFDPTRPVKAWFDSTVDASHPENVAVYKVPGLDAQKQWTLRQLVIKASEAASLNLTGSVQYAEYVIRPTEASRAGAGINPIYMSLESEAREWMKYFGGTDLDDEGRGGIFPTEYPPSEPRRMWYFMYRGLPINVGALLFNRHRRGVDAPGHWDTTGTDPRWIPDPPAPTGLAESYPAREMPLRELLPNEKLASGMMGDVYVVRTDKQAEQIAEADHFTPEDRVLLRAIHQMVSKK